MQTASSLRHGLLCLIGSSSEKARGAGLVVLERLLTNTESEVPVTEALGHASCDMFIIPIVHALRQSKDKDCLQAERALVALPRTPTESR